MTDLATLVRVFGRIGLLSFGGPAAQIALMHRELVEARGWLAEDEFLRGLSFCMLLPGPEAMQLAIWAGWRQRGLTGALIAGGLFVLPGAAVITALALLYGTYGALPGVQAAFLGVKAAVVAIVVEAILRVGRRALRRRADLWIAGLAFVALFALHLPFPLVILAAGLWGFVTTRAVAQPQPPERLAWRGPVLTLLGGAVLWLAPLAAVAWAGQGFLTGIGGFFAWLAILTFGGAYAVLAWMAQEVVTVHHWLTAPELMDALGLAETTPGPLILVTVFVGIVAGIKAGGAGLGLAAGALVAWVTFVPSFLFVLAGAPVIGWLGGRPRLQGALAAITAAVVGVIANLSLWFTIHVLFARQVDLDLGPLRLTLPDPASLHPVALVLTALAIWALLIRHLGLLPVLAASAGLGWAAGAAGLG